MKARLTGNYVQFAPGTAARWERQIRSPRSTLKHHPDLTERALCVLTRHQAGALHPAATTASLMNVLRDAQVRDCFTDCGRSHVLEEDGRVLSGQPKTVDYRLRNFAPPGWINDFLHPYAESAFFDPDDPTDLESFVALQQIYVRRERTAVQAQKKTPHQLPTLQALSASDRFIRNDIGEGILSSLGFQSFMSGLDGIDGHSGMTNYYHGGLFLAGMEWLYQARTVGLLLMTPEADEEGALPSLTQLRNLREGNWRPVELSFLERPRFSIHGNHGLHAYAVAMHDILHAVMQCILVTEQYNQLMELDKTVPSLKLQQPFAEVLSNIILDAPLSHRKASPLHPEQPIPDEKLAKNLAHDTLFHLLQDGLVQWLERGNPANAFLPAYQAAMDALITQWRAGLDQTPFHSALLDEMAHLHAQQAILRIPFVCKFLEEKRVSLPF